MQDVRLALRHLRNRPGFTLVAVLTLALGIGANTAVFTVVNAVLLRPLPYADPSRVVVLTEQTPQFPSLSVTRYNYDDWRARAQSFSGMGAVRATNMTLTGGADPERVPAKMITASLLPLLGVAPAAGRGFDEADDQPGAEGVALLSDSFARRRFPAGAALGQRLLLDNQPYTVVGLLPAGFELFQPADVFVPFGPWASTLPEDRGWHPGIFPVARLAPGVSIEAARAELTGISMALEQEFPESNRNIRAQVTHLQDQVVQNVRPALLMLLRAVALVLLIACANVANLLLARAVGRQKEMAVRAAVGAGRWRLVRQLVVESVVLSLIGAGAGLLVAMWGVSFLSGPAVTGLPRAQAIEVQWPVAAFALVLALVTGVIFGLVPALQTTRLDLRESLNEDGRGSGSGGARHRRLRNALVIAEVALALVLLVGAGLLLRSFAALTTVSPGFDASNLFVVDLPLSPVTYADDVARTTMVEQVTSRVRQIPGVRDAAITTTLPMQGGGATIHFNRAAMPPRGPDDYVMAGYRAVTPGYLSTLGVPLRRGRLLDERDRQGAPPVVVINESMARQYFADLDPLGQRIQLGTEPSPDFPTMEVVGIVGDMKQGFEAGAKAEMFVPYLQHPDPILAGMYRNTILVVRTVGEPARITGTVRAAVREVDPNQPLVNIRTMDAALANTVAQPRLQMVLLGLFAFVAAALAVVGVYGVMAYTVSQRTQEIGVRVAMGAPPGAVARLVVGQGLRLALAGVALGLLGALAAARAIEGLLFNVSGLDPITFVAAPLVLAAAAVLASYIPARRAARISPITALGR
ncbi:MAG: ABC transporter permease [Acidobacteria bacterium]|nr:ABC transporter permease [Acidobacteriota bacterium]